MDILQLIVLLTLMENVCYMKETNPMAKDNCKVQHGLIPNSCVSSKNRSINVIPTSVDSDKYFPSSTMCLFVKNDTELHVQCTPNGTWIRVSNAALPTESKKQAFTIIGATVGAAFGPVGMAIGAAIGFIGDMLCIFFCGGGDSGPPPNTPPSMTAASIMVNPVFAKPNTTLAQVTWTKPVAEDPEDGSLTVTSSPDFSGKHDFEEGYYFITFSARDSGGLSVYSNLNFQVKVLRCQQPRWPEKGQITCSNNWFISGSVCHLGCSEGYVPDDKARIMISCTTQGSATSWVPQALSPCIPRKCSAIPDIENGFISCPGNEAYYKTFCGTNCNKGYNIRSSGFVTCNKDGTWPEILPQCYDMEPPYFETCPNDINTNIDSKDNTAKVDWDIPTGIDNSGDAGIEIVEQHGHKPGNRFSVGIHTIRYTIIDSSRNRGNLCSFTLYVSTIECLEPDFGNHMTYICPDYYRFGAACQLSCRSGYPNIGVDKIQCLNPSNSTPPKLEWTWDRNGLEPACKESACQDLPAPANGALACSLWDHGNMCQMQCQVGFDVPLLRDGMFVCGKSDGQWRPNDRVPDCIEKRNANQMHLMSDLYYYTGQCNSSTQNLEQIKDNFIQALTASKYKELCVGVAECQANFVNVTCGPINARRRRDVMPHHLRRRSTASFAYAVTFDMTVPFKVGEAQSSLELVSANEDILNNMIDAVQAEVDAGKFDLNIGDLHTDSFSLGPGYPQLSCPKGSQGNTDTGSCIGCPTGQYFSTETGDCQYCPTGSYQNQSSSLDCKKCPTNMNTTDTGAKSVEQCLEYCGSGTFSSTGLTPCIKCQIDMYQPESYQTECLPCEIGTRAVLTGSTSKSDCQAYDLTIKQAQPVSLFNNHTSTAFSLKSWIQPGKTNESQTLFKLSSENGTFTLALKQIGTLNINIDGNTMDTGVELPSNTWSHVVFTADSSMKEMQLYINGQQAYSDTAFTSYRQRLLESHDTISINGDLQLASLSIIAQHTTAADVTTEAISCQATFAGALYTLDSFASSPNAKVVVPSKCDAIDECKNSSCGNFECINKIGEYECICTGNYSGRNCEVPPDFCSNHDCQNGASCVASYTNYTCKCPYGYSGDLCEKRAVDGSWSEWTQWNVCTVSCGGGQSTRTRACDSPAPDPEGEQCQGETSEARSCNNDDCPTCPNLRRSYGVSISCNETADSKRCTIRCRDGLFFATPPLTYYECGRITDYVWNHMTEDNPVGRLPSCTTVKPPSQMSISMGANYDTVSCSSDNANEAMEQLEIKFQSLDCVARTTCQTTVEASGCNGQSSRRKRSDVDTLKLTVLLEANIDASITGLTMEELMTNSSEQDNFKQLLQQVLELEKSAQQIANNSETFFRTTIAGQQHTIATGSSGLRVTPGANCHPGSVRLEAFCADSPAGSYSDGTTLTMCPKGQYQDLTAQTSCKQCPGSTTTTGVGSTDLSDCSETMGGNNPIHQKKTDDDDDTAHTVGVVVGTVATIGFFVVFGIVGTLVWKHVSKRKRQINDSHIDLYSLRMPRAEPSKPMFVKEPL